MLVIFGVMFEGKKEFVGFQVGLCESVQSWWEFLVDIKVCGFVVLLEIVVGDGVMGFWKVFDEVFLGMCYQRCWVYKIVNVLNKFLKFMQLVVKVDLCEIWQVDICFVVEIVMDIFVEKYGIKYDKVVICLIKDCEVFFVFYDFLGEYWDYLCMGNLIESVFVMVCYCMVWIKGVFLQKMVKLMVFKFIQVVVKMWCCFKGVNQLFLVIEGVIFIDGVVQSVVENCVV